MEALITATQFLLALSILIILHECGHFWAARAFGIRVEKFFLFFDAWGFKFFSFKKGDTEYGIGWLPMGGYVKIAGMVDESLDKEQMNSEPQPWEFRSKPAWQRLIVMIGGVLVNLILGIIITTVVTYTQGDRYIPNDKINELGGIYASPMARDFGFKTGDKILKLNGKPVDNLSEEFGSAAFLTASNKVVELQRDSQIIELKLPVNMEDKLGSMTDEQKMYPLFAPRTGFAIETVMAGSNASKAGLKKNDRIIAIDSVETASFFEFREMLQHSKNKAIKLTVLRGDSVKMDTMKLAAQVTEDGTLGFQPKDLELEQYVKVVNYTVLQSVVIGSEKSIDLLVGTAQSLGKVATGKVNAKKSLAGPVGIAQMFGGEWNWLKFWTLTALLSLTLAFMNILPIPALDGGHVMFLLWEMITGKPVTEKVLYVGQIIGMVFILSLMAFAFWVDIARALGF